MSKLDDAIALIMEDQGELSNAEIAKRIGCDEGLVRRARKEADLSIMADSIDAMADRIKTLEHELAQYRRATLPPKRDRRGQDRHFPLFEEYLKHFIVD